MALDAAPEDHMETEKGQQREELLLQDKTKKGVHVGIILTDCICKGLKTFSDVVVDHL